MSLISASRCSPLRRMRLDRVAPARLGRARARAAGRRSRGSPSSACGSRGSCWRGTGSWRGWREVAASRAATRARCASSSKLACMLMRPAHSHRRREQRDHELERGPRSRRRGRQRHAHDVGNPASHQEPDRQRGREPDAARRPAHERAITGITANQTRPGERSPPLASQKVTATAATHHMPARATRSVSPSRHSQTVKPDAGGAAEHQRGGVAPAVLGLEPELEPRAHQRVGADDRGVEHDHARAQPDERVAAVQCRRDQPVDECDPTARFARQLRHRLRASPAACASVGPNPALITQGLDRAGLSGITALPLAVEARRWRRFCGGSWPRSRAAAPSRSSRTPTPARRRSPRSCCSTAARSTSPARCKAARARATRPRDWMELEKERGISVDLASCCSSSYRGHARQPARHARATRTSREDTYRTLAAADSAVMLIDAAKGVEPQTSKLFEVCRLRGIPIFTFVQQARPPRPRAARADGRDREGARHRARTR